MWKSLKHLFSATGQKHPLDRKPTSLDKHPLGMQVANVIAYSQKEAQRLQHQKISSGHVLLALTKYPYGLAQKALSDLDVTAEKIEPLIVNEGLSSNLPSSAFLLLPEVDTIFKKAQDEARTFNSPVIASEHILLAMTHFKESRAYRILQQLNITPKLLRDKVSDLATRQDPTLLVGPQKIEKFTNRARNVLKICEQLAEQRYDRIIRVEYLLVALAREEGGVAGRALRQLGATTQRLESVLYLELERTPPNNEIFELSAEIKRTLELAVDEALQLRHHYIGTEHLLLGLLHQTNLAPVKGLTQLGITVDRVREKVVVLMAEVPP